MDMWKQSAINVAAPGTSAAPPLATSRAEAADPAYREWLKARMRWAWGRAASAMLVTSLTTGAAFVMNLSSDVTAIQIFGAFTGIMILINYVAVITLFPMVAMVYERHVQFIPWPCCFGGLRGACITPAADAKRRPEVYGGLKIAASKEDHGVVSSQPGGASGVPTKKRVVDDGEGVLDVSNYRVLERFFYNKVGVFVVRWRYAIVVIFLAYFALSVGFATQLSASEEPAVYLPKDDYVQRVLDVNADRFARSTTVQQINIMFGLKPIDLSGVNIYDPEDVGTTRFDKNFDPSSTAAQQLFVTMCEAFRDERFVLDREVLCPMEAFRDYVVDELQQTFPVPQADFVGLLANFTAWYESVNGAAPDYSGATGASEQDPDTREARAQRENNLYQTIRFDLTASPPVLRFMLVVVNTTLNGDASGNEIRPMYDHWRNVLSDNNADPNYNSATLGSALMTSGLYVNMQLEDTVRLYMGPILRRRVQRTACGGWSTCPMELDHGALTLSSPLFFLLCQLFAAAVLGIGASLAIAFLILLLLTYDVQLAVMAIVSIGGVVVSLICAMVWLGWDLSGTLTSKNVRRNAAPQGARQERFPSLTIDPFSSPTPFSWTMSVVLLVVRRTAGREVWLFDEQLEERTTAPPAHPRLASPP